LNSDKLMIAELYSGKQIMIVLNDNGRSCSYRYLSDVEIENSEFRTYGIFDWIETTVRMDVDIDSNRYVSFIEVDNQLIRWFTDEYNNPASMDVDLFKIHNLGRFV